MSAACCLPHGTMSLPPGPSPTPGGPHSAQERVHSWLASLPASLPGYDTTTLSPTEDCYPPASEYDCSEASFWVKGSIFAEQARILRALGAHQPARTSSTFEKQGEEVPMVTSDNDNDSREPMVTGTGSNTGSSIAIPRVRSSVRQIYQNWSVLPPVKAPTGTATLLERPLVPPPLPRAPECSSGPASPALTPPGLRVGGDPRVADPPPRGKSPTHLTLPDSKVTMVTENLSRPGSDGQSRDANSDAGRSEVSAGSSVGHSGGMMFRVDEEMEHICAYSRISGVTSHWDISNLHRALHRLQVSGWYYGVMSWERASARLQRSPVGAFLVRQSSDHRFLFSLSVKTPRGTTSIRLVYREGFRLDCCDPAVEPTMPKFDCVIALIHHYIRASAQPRGNNWVFYETSGRKDTPVVLTRPCHQGVLALKDLSRRALHAPLTPDRQSLANHLPVSLDPELHNYLSQYPYFV